MFDTDEYELKMQSAVEHFEAELKKVRTVVPMLVCLIVFR